MLPHQSNIDPQMMIQSLNKKDSEPKVRIDTQRECNLRGESKSNKTELVPVSECSS